MICYNCGARISKKDDRCPHCRAMIYSGAEAKYMENLESIKDKMTGLSTEPKHALIRGLGITICILAGLFCFVLVVMVIQESSKEAARRKEEIRQEEEFYRRLQWEDEVYPQLDAWYDKGDYDSIIAYRETLLDGENGHYIYRWRHDTFISIYERYTRVLMFEEILHQQEPPENYQYGEFLYEAMTLIYEYNEESLAKLTPQRATKANWGLTQEELELIEGYQQKVYQILRTDLHMTDQEIKNLMERCDTEGIVSACYDYAEERF